MFGDRTGNYLTCIFGTDFRPILPDEHESDKLRTVVLTHMYNYVGVRYDRIIELYDIMTSTNLLCLCQKLKNTNAFLKESFLCTMRLP